jgi:hypothetical protein
MKAGDKVYFGRANGEKTLGEVIKVNAKSVKVRQLESRGTMKAHKVGTVWKVAPSFVTPADPNAVPAADSAPPAKRTEAEVLKDIADCYGGLSPECLSGDGEYPPHVVARRRADLNRRLLGLLNEIGRPVSESEAYASLRPTLVSAVGG